MTIEKLASTDAFIVFDLDDAPSAGLVRSAPKILVDGATLLARSLTYRFASFERQLGGASSGINTTPEARAEAIAAYVAEVVPLVSEGRVLLQAGKGVAVDELEALRAVDPRPAAYWDLEAGLTALTIAVAAEVAAPGLDGRRVAIEGFDATGPVLAAALAERGALVVAVATASGTAVAPRGFEAAALADAWAAHGPALVPALDPDPGTARSVFGVPAEILVVGSKPGIVDDQVAGEVVADLIVAGGPAPVTAKGLAVSRRAGRVVVPDFLSTAGPLFAGWPTPSGGDPAAEATAAVTEVLREVLDHEDGPLLSACYRAEAFLRTWRESLPFGRPLA